MTTSPWITGLPDLQATAQEVAETLRRTGTQLVLAESCTAGLVAATLGGVPGISRFLCGSAVVYQEATKTAWLDVAGELFVDPGVVSAEVAAAMAAGALKHTPQADLAAAVTGDLGPGASAESDGVVFIALQRRGEPPVLHELRLAVSHADAVRTRHERQLIAAVEVLRGIERMLR